MSLTVKLSTCSAFAIPPPKVLYNIEEEAPEEFLQ
jgi:hypothetical protein